MLPNFSLDHYQYPLSLGQWAYNFALRSYVQQQIRRGKSTEICDWQDFLGKTFEEGDDSVFGHFRAINEVLLTQLEGPETLLSIDLNAPDALLEKQFSAWLKEKRAVGALKRQKLFSSADMARWQRLQLLPCLDLQLWGQIQGETITQHQLAQLLFSEEYDTDPVQKVRQRVIPLTQQMLEQRTILAMWQQALGGS